jgi:hypothetical protein
VLSTFAVPPDEEQLFSPLTEAIVRMSNPFAEIGRTLRSNIAGLLSTVSMPYTMAHGSAVDRHWQRIHIAARIRARSLEAEPDETQEALELRRDQEALAHANLEMDKFIHSSEGREALIADILGILERLRSVESFVGAANELILQGAVLCWGAFEVLARDCFIAYLNANPGRSLILLGDSVAKRRFELSKFSLETLAAHNFDLSGRMGTLLAQQQDLSDVYSVKAVYQALFPDQKRLFDALNDPDLRLLALRRNLIVHQRGVIDESYVTSTKCCQPVGERLKLSPANLEAHVSSTVMVAVSVLEAVSHAK